MLGMVKFGRQTSGATAGLSSSLYLHGTLSYTNEHMSYQGYPNRPTQKDHCYRCAVLTFNQFHSPQTSCLPQHIKSLKASERLEERSRAIQSTPLRIYSVAETESHYRRVVYRAHAYMPNASTSNNTYIVPKKRSAEFVCYDVECLDVVEHNGRIQLFDNDWG
jgi:hypothetical protein